MTFTICQNQNSRINFCQLTHRLIALFSALIGWHDLRITTFSRLQMVHGSFDSHISYFACCYTAIVNFELLRCYQCLLSVSLYSFMYFCFQTSIIWSIASSQITPLRVLGCLKALTSRATEDHPFLYIIEYNIDVSHWTNLIVALSLEQMLWVIAWQWFISFH